MRIPPGSVTSNSDRDGLQRPPSSCRWGPSPSSKRTGVRLRAHSSKVLAFVANANDPLRGVRPRGPFSFVAGFANGGRGRTCRPTTVLPTFSGDTNTLRQPSTSRPPGNSVEPAVGPVCRAAMGRYSVASCPLRPVTRVSASHTVGAEPRVRRTDRRGHLALGSMMGRGLASLTISHGWSALLLAFAIVAVQAFVVVCVVTAIESAFPSRSNASRPIRHI